MQSRQSLQDPRHNGPRMTMVTVKQASRVFSKGSKLDLQILGQTHSNTITIVTSVKLEPQEFSRHHVRISERSTADTLEKTCGSDFKPEAAPMKILAGRNT